MAALLVGMSVMAVLMSALLPVWTHDGEARKRGRTDFPRQSVRARHWAVPAQICEYGAADDRRAG